MFSSSKARPDFPLSLLTLPGFDEKSMYLAEKLKIDGITAKKPLRHLPLYRIAAAKMAARADDEEVRSEQVWQDDHPQFVTHVRLP